MADTKRTAHYVASTHWDREWYEPFQDYRFRLVRLLDDVLDLMKAQPEFKYFHTDGQAILVEDYLEVRPEREAELKELAQQGRFIVGPWYVMPDEFVVSGESLIRNLELGLETSARYGTPARVGFVCDMFGHISQLPQILRGFGIDNAFLFRGTNDRTHGAIWRWQGADGSELIVNRFPRIHGYTAYAFHVRKVMALDQPFEMQKALDELLQMVDREKSRHTTPSFLLFDGSDHIEVEPQTLELLRRANEQLRDVHIVHSHLEAFLKDIRIQQNAITDVFKGELRDPAELGDDALLLHGVLSSRMYLKQANARCENELCFWAEPFAAFADQIRTTNGPVTTCEPYPHQYLHLAWKHLITNHAHDSMCGCSLDAVHDDMMGRFRQSLQISSHVASDALRQIALSAARPELSGEEFSVIVFNPGSEELVGPVDVTLFIPARTTALFAEGNNFEMKASFRLLDANNQEVPYQLVGQRWNRRHRQRPLKKFPGPDDRHEIDVTVEMRVPAYGYTTLVSRPMSPGTPTRYPGSMLANHRTIENEFLRVSAEPNGTLRLLDKRTSETYEELLTFEDVADIGDGWYHGSPVNDEVCLSIGAIADIAVIANGPFKSTLKIALRMNLPRAFTFDHVVRSEQRAELHVTSYVTLRRGADHLEVRTVVENNICDHRLRVLLPSGVNAQTYFADSAFDVVERPIALRHNNAEYREMEVETKPQYTWTATIDQTGRRRGLAVVSMGLPESAVCDTAARPIALTLFRSFIKAFLTDGNEGGQMQGRHDFNYLLVPLDGSLPWAQLCRMGQNLASRPRAVQIERRDLADAPSPCLPTTHSFLKLSPGQAVVTAIRRHRDREGWFVRLFNPTDTPIQETISRPQPIQSVRQTDCEGNPLSEMTASGGSLRVILGPRQILTLQIV